MMQKRGGPKYWDFKEWLEGVTNGEEPWGDGCCPLQAWFREAGFPRGAIDTPASVARWARAVPDRFAEVVNRADCLADGDSFWKSLRASALLEALEEAEEGIE